MHAAWRQAAMQPTQIVLSRRLCELILAQRRPRVSYGRVWGAGRVIV